MTPDTARYMLAGFAVILLGIAAYAASLVFRLTSLKRKIKAARRKDKNNGIEDTGKE